MKISKRYRLQSFLTIYYQINQKTYDFFQKHLYLCQMKAIFVAQFTIEKNNFTEKPIEKWKIKRRQGKTCHN